MAVNCKNSLMNVNEKLYIDSYFKILQAKKGQPKHDYLDVLRDFIRQTDVHCSQQNITKHGAENFKTELYEEYYNTVDGEQHEGLLPVISESSKINFPLSRPVNLENYCKRFKGFLHSLTNKPSNEIKQYSPNPVINVRKNTPTLSNNPKFKNESLNKNDYSLNKPVSKKKFDSYSEMRPSGSKKFCMQPGVQSKKTPGVQSKADEIGFVTAKGMYRNPLSKQPSKSSKEETRDEDINLDNDEQSGLKNHETLKHFDKKIVDIVLNEIMDFSPNIKWSDIAGLEFVKTTVQEIVIWPLLRPDIFTGLRAPPRGILLFGPPGTGKTLIGKCIATESKSTFFCISASSLASKWVGESEQMVRVLFAVARLHQPAVIFIDEIDSLLSQRSDKDQDFTRKLKTEFLVQFDGAKTNTEERVLVVGATNRPHELDEAARRRFVKRLYVPLPDDLARCQIIKKLIGAHQHSLSEEDLKKICADTKGYSGSDVAHLCKEAAMGPIRCIGPESITTVSLDDVRPIALCDFSDALRQVRASVVAEDLNYYLEWNKKFGSFGVQS